MKKNGFIATSILYSFFLVFITLFIALIMNYLHNQVLLTKIDEEAWDMLLTINNTKVSDLEIGDHIKFKNKVGVTYLNDDATWIVAYIEETGNDKKYYFLSDLSAQLLHVNFKRPTDKEAIMHPIGLNIQREMTESKAYTATLEFPGINIDLPKASILRKVRALDIDEDIKNAIFNTKGDYVVHIDEALDGYDIDSYYDMRTYNFDLLEAQLDIVGDYCGGTYDGSKVNYLPDNVFGYMHIMRESVKNVRYVEYCSYASSIPYDHYSTDSVVTYDEHAPNDKITSSTAGMYTFRLMADVTVNKNDSNTYIAGGKGTSLDPYILTNGVKPS